MIPKKIHYIWFGGKELTPLAEKCIESWKKYCPDYEIIRWDENNFDINANRYCREAHEAGKWAFASDYARLWVLVNCGGIYMDTDVELIKSIDSFLSEKAFSGFEAKDRIPTGLMAAEAHHPLFEELLSDYETRSFLLPDGTFDTRTNVETITLTCLKYGLKLDNQRQVVGGFTLYPSDFFCPKDAKTLKVNLTSSSVAIHHFDGSWLGDSTRRVKEIKQRLFENAPWIPRGVVGILANVSYFVRTGDYAHICRLVAGKFNKFYRG